MPEVVYPTSKDGKERTWGDVFPELPDQCDDWIIINKLLENIAITNRFGCGICEGGFSWEKHKDHIIEEQKKFYAERIATTGDQEYAKYRDMWMKYIPAVYDNLGGAYRSFKS